MTRKVETIGDRLKRIRKENGYSTQQEVADIIGVSKTTVSNWENETSLPPADILIKLKDLYHVSIDYLLCRSEYTTPQYADVGEITGLSEKSITVLARFHFQDEYIFRENLKGLNYILESLYDEYEGVPYDVPINEEINPDIFEHFDKDKNMSFYTTIQSYTGVEYEFFPKEKSKPREGVIHMRVPRKDTILTDIYKYTHIKEYQDTEEFKELYQNMIFNYTHGLSIDGMWYALHMQDLQETLNKNRQIMEV